MGLSITPLLIHSEAVPPEARDALKSAFLGPQETRRAQLETAARAIFLSTDLDCREAREIVGLDSSGSCG
jgi:plasmid stability protein